MALTVTARGTGTHNSSALTFTLSPASNLAVGSLAVLVVSADNAAANGVAFTTFAVSDTKGNVWTRRVTPLYDPGAANAGVTGAQFTTDMAGGVLTTGTVITVTFDTATTAKAWAMWEVVPAVQKVVSYIASGVNTGSATTTPTVTTASLTSGDVVIGGLHNEYGTAQTVTADADATNGAWSAQQTDEIGTTAAGMTVASQAKVVSGTATQTYNPTLGTSSNVILSWLQLREIPFLKVGAVDQTSFALLASMSLRFNTFDFALKNPATIPVLGNAVTLGLPTWTGTVTSVKTEDLRVDYDLVTITATNTDVAGASAAPFGLSDAPNGTTTYSFRDMAVTQTDNLDATTTTTGSCTIQRAGLWPAMTFTITSANRGYAAQSFSVRNTTVTWPLLTAPVFKIDFGDPIVTMSVWVASQFANVPDGSISGTKITDLSVTTPKLAANAVTAAKITAGTITATEMAAASVSTDKLTIAGRTFASLVPNYSFEDSTGSAVPLLWTSSVVGTGVVSSTTGGQHGSRILALYSTSGSPNRADANGTLFPVTASQQYYLSSWRFHNPGSTTGAYLRISWYDSSLAALSNSDLIANGATVFAWTRWEGYVTAPASAAFAQLVLINYQPNTTGTLVWDEIVMLPYAAGVKNSTADVLIDAAGITVTNGAITVTNAGATVIIDGSSNMFKIAASGTLNLTGCNGTGAQCLATTFVDVATGLTTVPVHQSFVQFATDGIGRPLPRITTNAGTPGSVLTQIGYNSSVTGGNQTRMTLNFYSQGSDSSGVTAQTRYYIMVEQAL